MSIWNIFALIGGLAFFLFGMNIMSSHLEKTAGGKLRNVLGKLTSNPMKSIALGAGITIAIQSSSALTVMLVGLVNSGVMELSQTIQVIMGSNIGTTLTSWILSLNGISSNNFVISLLKPENFSPLTAMTGVFLFSIGKDQKKKDIGKILCGFSVLMFGMTMMSNSVAPLASSPKFQEMLIKFNNPILGIITGTIFTGIIQSSAASIGALQALAITGKITVSTAIPLIMGANIGTCITAILTSFGVNKNAKRVAFFHVFINILGTLIFGSTYIILKYIFKLHIFDKPASSFSIAIFHTLFNIATVIILLPFTKQLVKGIEMIIKDKKETSEHIDTVLLDERLLLSPSFAISEAYERTTRMATIAQSSFSIAMELFLKYNEKSIKEIEKEEDALDKYQDEINTFLIKLSSKSLSVKDSDELTDMLHCIGDFERIGDHAMNISKAVYAQKTSDIKFSEDALEEIAILTNAVNKVLDITVKSYINKDYKLAQSVEPLEEVIDNLTKIIKNNHIKRLQKGKCVPELGIMLTDYLTNCERVSDHCSNIAVCMIETHNSSFETHEYLHTVKNSKNTDFIEQYDKFSKQYKIKKISV